MANYTAASPVFAASKLSPVQFVAFLRAKRSPAAVEGVAIDAALTVTGVDTAVALGQFGAESSFGTEGYAARTRNWGNIAMATPGTPKLVRALVIRTHWTRRYGATPYSPGNGYTYAAFPSWAKGAEAYAALLVAYRKAGKAGSIETMTRRWLGGVGTFYIGNIVRIATEATEGSVTQTKPAAASPPVVVVTVEKFPAPRRATSPGPLRRFSATAELSPIPGPYSALVDGTVTIEGRTSPPTGSGFLRLSSGGSAGSFILAAEVEVA